MQQTPRRRAGQAWITPARLLGLLVALSGLMVMHGLSDHGAAGHLEGAGVHAMSGDQLGMSEVVGVHGPAGPDGHGLGMAGLCLAVLIAGVLTARALRHRTTRLVTKLVGPRLRAVAPRARAPDPPDLHRLSVHRC